MEVDVNARIQTMATKFKQLRTTQFPIVKKMIIAELRKMAVEIEEIMRDHQVPENTRRRRQIDDVIKKCQLIEKELNIKAQKDIGNVGSKERRDITNYTQADLTKMAARSVAMMELRSSQINIRPQQIQELVAKMHKNQQVMAEIEALVIEQGNDLDKIDQYLEIAYENVKEANVELQEANKIQQKTRMMKIRLAVSGFFGALGYKILGFPGFLFGLVFGAKTV